MAFSQSCIAIVQKALSESCVTFVHFVLFQWCVTTVQVALSHLNHLLQLFKLLFPNHITSVQMTKVLQLFR